MGRLSEIPFEKKLKDIDCSSIKEHQQEGIKGYNKKNIKNE